MEAATRQRVLAAIAALEYRPNAAARALATGRFGAFGVATFDLSSYGSARTLAAITVAAQAERYAVTIVPVAARTERAVRNALDHLAVRSVDGVVVVESELLDHHGLRFPDGMAAVVVNGEETGRPSVDTDQAAGARMATEHLLDLGHRSVWHVSGPENDYAARHRAASWVETLVNAGRPVPPRLPGDWSAASGYAAGRWLAEQVDATAIFAANDEMALGVLRALHEAGRRVPDEASVVGFDDIPQGPYLTPPLTTVRQDFDEVGRACVALLLDQLQNRRAVPVPVTVSPSLVVRASTGPPGQ